MATDGRQMASGVRVEESVFEKFLGNGPIKGNRDVKEMITRFALFGGASLNTYIPYFFLMNDRKRQKREREIVLVYVEENQ